MEFTSGKMDGSIRGTFKMITGMGSGSFMMVRNVCIEGIGKMVNKSKTSKFHFLNQPGQQQAFR